MRAMTRAVSRRRFKKMKTSLVAVVFAGAAALSSAFARTHAGALTAASPAGALAELRTAAPRTSVVLEAVPKSRQSKMKTRQRKAKWFAKW